MKQPEVPEQPRVTHEQDELVLTVDRLSGQLAVTGAVEDDITPDEQTRDEVGQIFQSGSLLVRAFDPPTARPNQEGELGLQYDVIDREVDDLFGRGDEHGLWYASSTLLLPGKRIPIYKGFGLMFDGQTAELHHVHEKDSGSNGQGDDFMAAVTELSSLAELAAVVSNEAPVMNEVNATFKASDLKGIFALEAIKPSGKVGAWLMQQRLRSTTGVVLPMYVYDINAGAISSWDPTRADIERTINKAFAIAKMRTAYIREFVALGE